MIEENSIEVDQGLYLIAPSPIDRSPLINGSIEISQLNSSKDFVLSGSVDKRMKNISSLRTSPHIRIENSNQHPGQNKQILKKSAISNESS